MDIIRDLDKIFGSGFETRDGVLNFGWDDYEYLRKAAGCLGGQRRRGSGRVGHDGSDRLTLVATEASVRLFAHKVGFGYRALR